MPNDSDVAGGQVRLGEPYCDVLWGGIPPTAMIYSRLERIERQALNKFHCRASPQFRVAERRAASGVDRLLTQLSLHSVLRSRLNSVQGMLAASTWRWAHGEDRQQATGAKNEDLTADPAPRL